MELGAVDYVTKPISQPILLARIRTHLALNQARQRLRGISDNLLEGIVLVGMGDRLLFVNRPAIRIMGLNDSPKDLVGRHRERLFQLRRDDPSSLPWQDVIDHGATYVDSDTVFLSPSGKEITVSYGCSPLDTSEFGRAVIITFRDITAQKRVQFEAMLAARQAVVGHLAAGVAHEINTPAQFIASNLCYIEDGLNVLAGIIEAAKAVTEGAPGTPVFSDRLARLKEAVSNRRLASLLAEMPKAAADSRDGMDRIDHLVVAMKEFSRPGTTGRTATDINRAIMNTLAVSRSTWASVAEVKLELAPALPLVVCHASELGQVFINLILNAVQAIEASAERLPGQISIATRRSGDLVEIEVADTGGGVPPEIREQIFDPFFTTKPVGMGTGLGLAICHDVVAIKHGGSLVVGEGEGHGAVFTIRLPVGNIHDD